MSESCDNVIEVTLDPRVTPKNPMNNFTEVVLDDGNGTLTTISTEVSVNDL